MTAQERVAKLQSLLEQLDARRDRPRARFARSAPAAPAHRPLAVTSPDFGNVGRAAAPAPPPPESSKRPVGSTRQSSEAGLDTRERVAPPESGKQIALEPQVIRAEIHVAATKVPYASAPPTLGTETFRELLDATLAL